MTTRSSSRPTKVTGFSEKRTSSITKTSRQAFECLCVDLDGTLIDTERLHIKAERLALGRLGISELSNQQPITFGAGLEEGAAELCEYYGIDLSRYLAEYLPIWNRSLATDLELLPGALSLLETADQRGITVALVTSGDAEYAGTVTRRLTIDGFFSCVITSDSVSSLKPHPEPYLRAAEGLGAEAQHCVGIEDSGMGVSSLISAGMYAVAVHENVLHRPELSAAAEHFTSLTKVTDTVIQRLFRE